MMSRAEGEGNREAVRVAANGCGGVLRMRVRVWSAGAYGAGEHTVRGSVRRAGAGEWLRGLVAGLGGLGFAAEGADQFGNCARGKGIGQWTFRIGFDDARLAQLVAIFEEPAREHGLRGFLEPLVHQCGDFMAKVGSVVKARQFEALERGCGSLSQVVQRRVERLQGHVPVLLVSVHRTLLSGVLSIH
jgi:hypothetical protein